MPENFGRYFFNAMIGGIIGRFIEVVRHEWEVAKLELKHKGVELAKGAAMLAVASILGYFMLLVLLAAAVLGLAEVFEPWLAALIVAGAILFWVLILGLWGAYKVKKNKDLKPERAITNIKEALPFVD
ncbi:phage holin family protein [Demequina sp.]|uniref:phage holin family protein n=1 Tax=Demequina sp. TaxID=2050685 RepID=UPI0025D50E07|nr:phage holin family protein [Demequina sp.]